MPTVSESRTAVGPEDLYASPNALAEHYGHFRVAERLLLTGHSHQAWPDRGFEGQKRAWLDAAEHVDGKWDAAFAAADRVRAGFRALLDDRSGHIALGSSTFELVVRFLSALPLRERPRLVTTDGEFHTVRRLLDRLAEERIEVVRVPAAPVADLAGRVAEAVDDRTAGVLLSSVLFRNAQIVPELGTVAAACDRTGTSFLVDAYHHLNVVPMSLGGAGLEGAFVVGGGYKYCQLGEGNCFLRFPWDCHSRPVATGWFSEFTALAGESTEEVSYGAGPDRFAGSTYDPTSHYRAAAVLDFFEEHALAPSLLRVVSQHQIGLLAEAVDGLGVDPAVLDRDRSVPVASLGGFLALQAPRAQELSAALERRDVFTDARGEVLRLGPAPYLSDRQLLDAVGHLGEAVREVGT